MSGPAGIFYIRSLIRFYEVADSVREIPGLHLFHRHVVPGEQLEGGDALPEQHVFAAESQAPGLFCQLEEPRLHRVVDRVRDNEAGFMPRLVPFAKISLPAISSASSA